MNSAVNKVQEFPKLPQHRIPSLDGCRAVSIFVVLLAHLCNTPALQGLNPYARIIYHFGPFGVKVFFVISGYLITTLLMNEERKAGRISLGQFYFRRAFRIWPVAYAFILVVALLDRVNWISLPAHNLIFAATFTMNHTLNIAWWTEHLWSLAIEEQFYLVWPFVFLLANRRWRVGCCLFLLMIAPVLRIFTYIYAPKVYWEMQASLLFMSDSIAVGCLLALLSTTLHKNQLVDRAIRSPWFYLLPLLSIGMYATLKPWFPFYLAVGESVAVLCIAATIWRVIHVRDRLFLLLNSRALVTVGLFSYSLYVWQQLFLSPTRIGIFNTWPLNLIGVCAAAIVSYYGIELPFLRIRARLSSGRNRAKPLSRDVSVVPSRIESVSRARRTGNS